MPNGVVTNLFPGEIDVWNPTPNQATGFLLVPTDKSQPTIYTNVFRFTEPVTIGVRVFLVSPNDAFSLSPVVAQTFPEFMDGRTYLLNPGDPFYVGLYTGGGLAPPYPPTPPLFYTDPVFGWAKLVNNQGVIQLLDYAVAYKAQGIFVGTPNLVPEPRTLAHGALGIITLAARRKHSRR